MMKRMSLWLGVVALAALPFGMQAQEPGYPQTVPTGPIAYTNQGVPGAVTNQPPGAAAAGSAAADDLIVYPGDCTQTADRQEIEVLARRIIAQHRE